MLGTPYWGKETFEDIRILTSLESSTLTISKIEDLCKSKGSLIVIEDTYTLFLALAKLDWLFVIEDEGTWLSWCRDIRFNYRDRFIFVPYYTYLTERTTTSRSLESNELIDTLPGRGVNVRYNFELKSHILDHRKTHFKQSSLVLYDHVTHIKYKLDLPHLPYFKEDTFSLIDLANRYVESSYVVSKGVDVDGWKRYISIKNKSKKNKEYKLRKELGLPTYAGKYVDINYTDVRQYSYEEVFNSRLEEEKNPYWLRVYEFEAFLYCVMAQNLPVSEDDYRADFEALGVTKRYMTITESLKPFTLKYYYKDNVSMRRKSFERFK